MSCPLRSSVIHLARYLQRKLPSRASFVSANNFEDTVLERSHESPLGSFPTTEDCCQAQSPALTVR